MEIEWNLSEEAILARRWEWAYFALHNPSAEQRDFHGVRVPEGRDVWVVFARLSPRFLENTDLWYFEDAMGEVVREVQGAVYHLFQARLYRGNRRLAEFYMHVWETDLESSRTLEALAWERAAEVSGRRDLPEVPYPEPKRRKRNLPHRGRRRFLLYLPPERLSGALYDDETFPLPVLVLEEEAARTLLALQQGGRAVEVEARTFNLLDADMGPLARDLLPQGRSFWEALVQGVWTDTSVPWSPVTPLTAWREGDGVELLVPWEEGLVWHRVALDVLEAGLEAPQA